LLSLASISPAFDKDEDRVAQLAKGESPIYEPRLGEMLQKNLRERRIQFTTDTERAVKQSLVVFISVGTPPREDGSADLQYIESVAKTPVTRPAQCL
jgi:UDPglucose 6-dehydrogenase